MLAEKGAELGGPWSDHLKGPVCELRIRLRDVVARITCWCTADGRIVLLTVFRMTRQQDQRQIDRAVRAQKACERGAVTGVPSRRFRRPTPSKARAFSRSALMSRAMASARVWWSRAQTAAGPARLRAAETLARLIPAAKYILGVPDPCYSPCPEHHAKGV